ncbi:glutamate-1-semialdehyde 2,1-aminomutase [Geoglobus acetivorans]|uniref:Glutamate-1-semialdehyde 2,1-aminomutase n=1 Tax=Geoglobus acetivorans TaxID=565033 RepID=A0A0A7GDZ5_GEOAI|nr:Glutamate-1-semialdehyde aminotransferase [Geoglobus acetivorans]
MWGKSKELYETARSLMPGGVSSPVRAVKPFPFYTKKAKGSKIYDVDGNEYIDYCMAYGPLILGHGNERVKNAVKDRLEDGWVYGTPIELEIEYAKLITDIYPSIDMVRFTNTGSEATMAALRLAKGFTGKKKFIKIEGSFHGAHDSVLVKAGSGATTHGTPNSAGVPEEFVINTLQAPYNNVEALSEVIEKNREDIAALILEPVMGNASLIIPDDGYLREIRKITMENDVLLIFDEVITGFRLSLGGAQEYFGVEPDITTLGKIAGGGFPIGIVGGRKEILEKFSPSGPVYQAGTFSGNPISLTAGYTTARILEEEKPYDELRKKTENLVKALKDEIHDAKLNVSIGSIESMFCIYFGEKPRDYSSALKLDNEKFMEFYWKLLENGVFFPPSQYETCFMSVAHEPEDVEKTAEVIVKCLRAL